MKVLAQLGNFKLRLSTLLLSCCAVALVLAPTLSILDALPSWVGETGPDNWSEAERSTLASLQLRRLPDIPIDPSNRYENQVAAINFGKKLFFDTRLSKNEAISCASCHDPQRQFQDGKPMAQGLVQTKRRTMQLGAVAYAPFLFWDGRKDSLWSQALSPLEDPAEHGNTRLGLSRLISSYYRAEYEAIFAPLPNFEQLPLQAGPFGTQAQQETWQNLPVQTRNEISRVFVNLGKALAAYEKTLQFTPSRLDQYIDGVLSNNPADSGENLKLLSASEKNGLRLFIGKAQCVTCHNGPLFTDQSFHNTGVMASKGQVAEIGRKTAIAALRDDPFNCLGQFSDAKPEQCAEMRFLANDNPAWLGAFKTPSLRGVAMRPPYMHQGQLATLEAVAAHYQKALPATLGHNEADPLQLTPAEVTELVAFLHSLNSNIIETKPK